MIEAMNTVHYIIRAINLKNTLHRLTKAKAAVEREYDFLKYGTAKTVGWGDFGPLFKIANVNCAYEKTFL